MRTSHLCCIHRELNSSKSKENWHQKLGRGGLGMGLGVEVGVLLGVGMEASKFNILK